ncbi:MAG: MarR family transcriptional regulator [Candidatus Nezhaarchaeales archaeon]
MDADVHLFLSQFEKPATSVEAAKRLGVTHAAVLRRLKKYESKGLVRRGMKTQTYFVGYYWELTSEGKRLLDMLKEGKLRNLRRL